MRPNNTSVLIKTLSVLFLLALLGSLYLWEIRPSQLHWGATPAECSRLIPADQSVGDPGFDATRAITIHATPEQIFPWLVQMGFGRAGFYGYDLIENVGGGSGIRSAQTILPALQSPRSGDLLPLSVAATLMFGPIEPNHLIVWRSRDVPCDGVFIWELEPIDAAHTRLISRIRWNYVKSPKGLALGIFTEFADHVAVRKILEGVRDRAEGRPPQSLTSQAFEIASWCLAVLNLTIALFFVGLWRKWGWAWLIALGAGLLLEFVLYSSVPLVIRAILPWFYLCGIVMVGQMTRRAVKASPVCRSAEISQQTSF